MKPKILFLVPYPLGVAPSQRFRFEQYFEILEQNGFDFDSQSFIDEQTWKILYLKGYLVKKTIGIFSWISQKILLAVFLKKVPFYFYS